MAWTLGEMIEELERLQRTHDDNTEIVCSKGDFHFRSTTLKDEMGEITYITLVDDSGTAI